MTSLAPFSGSLLSRLLPWVALAALVLTIGGGMAVSVVADAGPAGPVGSPPAAAGSAAESAADSVGSQAARVPADRRRRRAREVLRSWDARRADAWASGDFRELRRLYTPGSVAGEHDVAMLRRWTTRGLWVVGLRTEVLSLTVVRAGPLRLRLRTIDRVSAARAVGGGAAISLPHDRADVHVVELRRTAAGEEWRVASVTSG